MIIQTHAHARAGLIGNPSDGYFGKTISISVRNFAARVSLWESPRLTIIPQRCDRLEYDGFEDLADDVRIHGYYGGIRLIKAAIKRFHDYCGEQGITLAKRNFTIAYETDIPVRVGLAGSSGIVTATMRALMEFFGVTVPRPRLPNLILSAELDGFRIGAGLQDRVIQTYEGVVFMDFDKALMERQGHGHYESLDPSTLPPLFVAYHDSLAEGTEIVHNDLRARYQRGEKAVLDGMKRFAELAQQVRDLIAAGRGGEIAPLMNANFDLRSSLCVISAGNRRLVEIGRQFGTSCKFAGSGGAVIGTYDGDPRRFERLKQAYTEFGAKVFVPWVTERDEQGGSCQ